MHTPAHDRPVAPPAPAGFVPLFRTSPALELIGPVLCRGTGAALVLGLRAEGKHCNARGTVHGGILACLADTALGYAVAFASDPPMALATVSLTVDYASTASVGDWLEASVDIQKRGARLAFANCYISVADVRIVRASAVFAVPGADA